ncbi:MAG: aminoglycoside phosphotransferase family protein [Chitinophagaceae bacterium]|nr:MAG: aminoglycoside phosphotransferase family protein [Chitinophagaceae bacterium]
MLEKVYKAFGVSGNPEDALAFGSGLINHTWKVNRDGKFYVLQRINQQVFRDPNAIAFNINFTAKYLRAQFPGYLFVTPEQSLDEQDIFHDRESGYYRMSPFVDNSHTIDVVTVPEQAFEAARQFGLFTRLLGGMDASQLRITLPDFHNLSLRYEQFEQALANGNRSRIGEAGALIDGIIRRRAIVERFEEIRRNPSFKIRATHHDTKISNVLFDHDDKGLCVIDLDTLMPGYFISDFGDMMRTYLSPVSEEEKDFSLIQIRDEFFEAIVQGYLGEMKTELGGEEKAHLVYAGKFMIYMQAIRFLTDHLNNDVYYGAKYEGHNLLRAANQLELLKRLEEKEAGLLEIVSRY